MFSLLQMNIRSIPGHLHELEAQISNSHHELSIIAISETWLSDAIINTNQIEGHYLVLMRISIVKIDAEVEFLCLSDITRLTFLDGI